MRPDLPDEPAVLTRQVRLPYPIVEDADKQTAAAIDKMLALKQARSAFRTVQR